MSVAVVATISDLKSGPGVQTIEVFITTVIGNKRVTGLMLASYTGICCEANWQWN